jgi:hypothetical protein
VPIDRTEDRLDYPPGFPLADILPVVKKLTHLEAVGGNAPRPVLGATGREDAYILATTLSSRQIGKDETRMDMDPRDPTGATLRRNVCGVRQVVISFRCECFQAQLSPVTVLERLRWGWNTMAGWQALNALNVAVAHIENIQHLGTQTVNKRAMRIAVMDVTFNWALNWVPPADLDGTIASVDGGTQEPGTPPTIPNGATP